jgi:hypothetical protein
MGYNHIVLGNSGGSSGEGGGDTDRTFYASTISTVGLAVKRIAGQVGKLFGIYKEDNSFLVGFNKDGTLLTVDGVSGTKAIVNATAENQGIRFYGAGTGQTFIENSTYYQASFSGQGLSLGGYGSGKVWAGTYSSKTSPIFSIVGDYDTGMYRPAANTIGLTAGGGGQFEMSTTKAAFLVPVALSPYTTAGRPAASTATGSTIYDSDLALPIYSDGTNWRNYAGVTV